MERIEKSIEVRCPVHTVYNQWTQFEEFPKFMTGVKEVKQLDNTHLHWHAEVWGKDKEWDAEIVEQVPDQRIAWRSTSGDAPNNGTVRFEPNGYGGSRRSRMLRDVRQGLGHDEVGDRLDGGGRPGRDEDVDRDGHRGLRREPGQGRVETTVKQFRDFIEHRGGETGAWRGEVHGGQKTPR